MMSDVILIGTGHELVDDILSGKRTRICIQCETSPMYSLDTGTLVSDIDQLETEAVAPIETGMILRFCTPRGHRADVRVVVIMTIKPQNAIARLEGFESQAELLAYWDSLGFEDDVTVWAIDFRLKKEVAG